MKPNISLQIAIGLLILLTLILSLFLPGAHSSTAQDFKQESNSPPVTPTLKSTLTSALLPLLNFVRSNGISNIVNK
jgi:ABC-type sulfate transport system permease component